MDLACGCAIAPGLPVSQETLKLHYKHTFEALFFWELLVRLNTPQDDRHIRLSQARAEWSEALEALYPELKEETPP